VYASSWLKVHYPAAFAASLVNSQPMGFYSPSTIFQDAQKHGVEVRPVDVVRSDWDCTLEGEKIIRVGLRQVRGLGEETGRRIESARAQAPFASVEDLAERAALKKNELEALAEAGALELLVAERREAIWKVRVPRGPGRLASDVQTTLFAGMDLREPPAGLPGLTRVEELALDYERTGLSVKDHPMRIARPRLPSRIKSAVGLAALSQGTRASAAGLVICRQRPMTASGVVFITMEDETGFLNLILYAHVFERFHHVATTSSLLLAHGAVEREGEVVYLVTRRLEPLRLGPWGGVSMSRDFH
jgi:error-prone DNA polymerase